MNNLKIVNDKMTTLDFAELTGTSHKHVLDKARKLLIDLEIGEPNFRASYLSSQNKQLPMLALDRDLSLTLAGQYEPKIAYQVAKAFNTPKTAHMTRIQLLENMIVVEKQNEQLRLEVEAAKKSAIIRLSKIGQHLAGSTISELENNVTFNNAAKIISTNLEIKLGHNSLMKLCRDNGWLMTGRRSKSEQNMPTESKIQYFKIKLFHDVDTDKVTITPVITPEGVVKLSELIPLWFTEIKW